MRIRIKKQTALALNPRTTVFFEKGEFILGPWQKIILIEFNGPRERTIAVNFIS